ncbi:mitochondrial carrier protein [Nitzschia inconspicua]|uniref:Mitochondrial carrier protein n=1 Tax=Nitzschia inconspicua TaxID=303405 RepID=A0A9K3LII1_9STRA|nr:mitochondrial carrier protein [Nitzschia inconspicua]
MKIVSLAQLNLFKILLFGALVSCAQGDQQQKKLQFRFLSPTKTSPIKVIPSIPATKKDSKHATAHPLRGGNVVPMIGPIQSFLSALGEVKSHLAAAAVARGSSFLACYPIDTIKTRIQTRTSNPFGIAGLYGGIGSGLFGQIPYAVLTFGSYEQYKRMLRKRFPEMKPVFAYAIAAVLGDVTGSGWLCPAEVVKQKLQANVFESTGQAVSQIWFQEGVGGFYRGYWNSLMRDVPFRVAQLTTYEVAKNFYLRFKRSQRFHRMSWETRTRQSSVNLELSPVESAVLGGVAGCISTLITQPMDVIRTLMMTNSAAYGNSMVICLKNVLHHNGIRGIYSGLVPRLAYVAPSVAIFFIVYEMTQQKLKQWE